MAYQPRIRLLVSDPLVKGAVVALSKDQSHYLTTVMRKSVGDQVALFNGRDGEWWATITDASKKAARLTLTNLLHPQRTEPDIWLAFAPIKSARTDFIVEKATELGASAILPVRTARTLASRVNQDRFEKTVQEAAEQCERLSIPAVSAYQSLSDLLAHWPPDRVLVFCDESLDAGDAQTSLAALNRPVACGLLVGPEGGFTKEERDQIKRHPACLPIHLGPRILRADTAALSGLTLLQSHLGDWAADC